MSREDDMFRARRNNVNSSSVVGKMLNSTGLVMYIETSSTITETVMLALISRSNKNDGIGMIIASTMPRTAKGTAISPRFPNRDFSEGDAPAAFEGVFAGAARGAL